MLPSDFLRRVCPDGKLVVAEKVTISKPQGGSFTTFRHSVCNGADAAAGKIAALAAKSDTYFALASWKQGFFEQVTKTGKKKKVVRVRSNVDKLKALWFDIDFKDGYGDLKPAMVALNDHCKATGLPLPSIIVHSGNGIHVYWPLKEAVPHDQWQVLADAFKEAARKTGLQADLVCTADACRVLRPPGTSNFKDRSNTKQVRVLHCSDRDFDVSEIESCIRQPDSPTTTLPSYMKSGTAEASHEFTGTNSGPERPAASFANLTKHCGFAKFAMESGGAQADEPEWKDTLQLLSHCEDGQFFLHDLSDKHPGYSPEETNEKFQQRLDSGAGPTLCTTFAGYRPEICHKCPHWGKVKTPVHIAQAGEENKPLVGLPLNYRFAKKGGGIQKLVIDDEGNKEWVRILRHNIDGLTSTRSINDDTNEVTFEWWIGDSHKRHIRGLTGGTFSNTARFCEFLGNYGLHLIDNEPKELRKLMGTWIGQLQQNKKEKQVAEQLGWIVDKNEETQQEAITGFSCGTKAYMTDGTEEGGVRVRSEYEAIAKHYEPKGSFDRWKEVAKFITDQNYGAYTAVLASAFAAPLIRFTGEQGAVVSLCSQESGVGKSSAMKIAQSVWGNPIHGVNSVNDTRNSVTRKTGFLNNLPCYWDEVRGDGVMEELCEMVFQFTQGKEKSRLDATARLKESVSWCTMMIAASNDSIFAAMGNAYRQTDAGMVRVFEINVQPTVSNVPSTKISAMVDQLQHHYGHAGRAYAKWLAENHVEAEKTFGQVRDMLEKKFKRLAVERFWFAALNSMVAGAVLAKRAGVCDIDVKKLVDYLGKTLAQLRTRSGRTMDANSAIELVNIYHQAHMDRILTVKHFQPSNGKAAQSYVPEIVGSVPQSGKIILCRQASDGALRFVLNDFKKWLESRGEDPNHVLHNLRKKHGAKVIKTKLALGTSFELGRMFLIEIVP